MLKSNLQPPENINVHEWADKYRRLPAESSAEPGKWRTERTPYLKDIMTAISDPKVRKVVMMTSAQIGKSELLLNSIGYFSDIDPCPMLMVQPTVDAGTQFSKSRIEPMIRDTPVLSKIFGGGKKRDSKNTIMQKFFPGGYLAIVGANSPAGLASRPIKVIFADEIDRWNQSAGKEGDPLTIVEKRTTTFPHTHKLIYVSTPTTDGISRIQHEYNQGSMEQWKLPCPSCGHYQVIEWANIIFHRDEDTKEFLEDKEVTCVCTSCGEAFNEMEWKSQQGKWFEQTPNAVIKSYHLSALNSPWKPWRDIAKSFLTAKNETEMLKVWTNTEMGLPWMDASDSISADSLEHNKVTYDAYIPKDVLVITAGVDVQDDRLEFEVVGWGVGKRSWGIEYKVIHGNTSQPETWKRLDEHLKKVYTNVDGTKMTIARTCIDSGGHRTTEVYNFCKDRENRGVYAIKGRGGSGMNIVHTVTKSKRVGNALFIIGVDTAKDRHLAWLSQTYDHESNSYPHGYYMFPLDDAYERGYDNKYFEGLVSEVKVTKMQRGRPKTEWKLKSGVRNEPLDCRIYNIAAIEIMNPNFEELKKRINATQQKPKRKKGTVSRGVEV